MLTHFVKFERFRHKLVKAARRAAGIKKTVYVQERVHLYRQIWETAARELGFEFVPLSESVWEIREGTQCISRFDNYIVQLDDPVTLNIAGDKLLTYKLLQDAGLTIPRFAAITIDCLDVLRRFMKEVKGPFVIKPARNTSSGLGVTTHLNGYRQCLSAAGLALTYCHEAVIEEQIVGESYRLLFLGHQMVCASRRTGTRVVGDGQRTIAQLLDAHDATGTASRRLHSSSHDRDVRTTLARQHLTLQSVPAVDATVLVRSAGGALANGQEIRTVYTEDVTDLVCDALIEEGRKASLAVGSEFCGVDLITRDPTVPLDRCGGVINEVNTTPGLHHHYLIEASGRRERLAKTVLEYLVSKADTRRMTDMDVHRCG